MQKPITKKRILTTAAVLLLLLCSCADPKNTWLARYRDGSYKRGFIEDFSSIDEAREFIDKHFKNKTGNLLIFTGRRSYKRYECKLNDGRIMTISIYYPNSTQPEKLISYQPSPAGNYLHRHYTLKGALISSICSHSPWPETED